ncbi:MAG: hypothetical protein HYZ44_09890 [Bacteroidetes bacterium]|nr:hypothetical protein [Bacteroidota bacterium]
MKISCRLFIVGILIVSACSKNDEPALVSAESTKNSYLPLTPGSKWQYTGAYSYSVEMTGNQKTIDGKPYFETKTTSGTNITTGYARMENGAYYSRGTIVQLGQDLELVILKDNVAVGTTWEKSITANSIPTTYRFTIDGINLSQTVLGKNYTKVIRVKMETLITYFGSTINYSTQYIYYAYGVGVIQTDSDLLGLINLSSYTIK